MKTLQNTPIRAGIVGGAGYTGGELLRLLLRHPQVEIGFVQSRSQAGQPLSAVHGDLLGETELRFSADASREVDVLFLCLGHGESRRWLNEHLSTDFTGKIIDLSQDFRLGGRHGQDEFVYGLPEACRDQIRSANRIANPGCFATGIQLALLPIASLGLLNEVFVTGITGATGAGQSLSATSHFPWRHANVSAYKSLNHQHLQEITNTLRQAGASTAKVHFVPWRGDFARGIFVSCTLACPLSQAAVLDQYRDFYETHPFTVISDHMIDLKMAVNTNKCLIFPEKQGDFLIVHATLDNLLKGASGQAVQNMNLLFGFEETAGLHLKASAF